MQLFNTASLLGTHFVHGQSVRIAKRSRDPTGWVCSVEWLMRPAKGDSFQQGPRTGSKKVLCLRSATKHLETKSINPLAQEQPQTNTQSHPTKVEKNKFPHQSNINPTIFKACLKKNWALRRPKCLVNINLWVPHPPVPPTSPHNAMPPVRPQGIIDHYHGLIKTLFVGGDGHP